MLSRAQQAYQLAGELVSEVKNNETSEVCRIYRNLWREFPIMIMQSGQAQAVSYHAKKAAGEGSRAKAHEILLAHCAVILGLHDQTELVQNACGAECAQYLESTVRLLRVAPFFKNVAEAFFGEETPNVEA